jgi:hypothetical protein
VLPAIEPEEELKVSQVSVDVADQFKDVLGDPVFWSVTARDEVVELPWIAEKAIGVEAATLRVAWIIGGTSDTIALATLVESAALVAATVTVCEVETDAGAVYRPDAEMLPSAGLSDQLTAVFEVLATAVVNAWACAGRSATLNGVNAALTGNSTLKIFEATELLTEFLIATALTVAELINIIGPV